jgi:hypothetical protein
MKEIPYSNSTIPSMNSSTDQVLVDSSMEALRMIMSEVIDIHPTP